MVPIHGLYFVAFCIEGGDRERGKQEGVNMGIAGGHLNLPQGFVWVCMG